MRRSWVALLLVAATVRCDNAGAGRVLEVESAGIVKGLVYLDRNGNRVADPADTALRNVRVRLIAAGTFDTTAAPLSDSSGQFRVTTVPAGSYNVALDTTTLGDSVKLVLISATQVTVRPRDSLTITATVSFPLVSVRAARLLPPGKKVFIQGVLLSPRVAFGDTTGHFADTSRAIRLTRMRAAAVGIGDSIRLLGVTSIRDGQATLDDAAPILLGTSSAPVPTVVTPVVARTANGGVLDAALVSLVSVKIFDTLSVDGVPLGPKDYRLRVNTPTDTSLVEVLLDINAGIAPTPRYRPDSTITVTGVLVPIPGTPGRWRVKPRNVADAPP